MAPLPPACNLAIRVCHICFLCCLIVLTILCIAAATYHAFVYMSKAFASNAMWQQRGAPVYSWLMSKQVRFLGMPMTGNPASVRISTA